VCQQSFYLIKFDGKGVERKRYPLNKPMFAVDQIAVSDGGDSYLLAALKFDSGSSTVFDEGGLAVVKNTNDARFEYLLLKYDATGSEIFRNNLTVDFDFAVVYGISLDLSEGAIYVAGQSASQATLTQSLDTLIAKYDLGGALVWKKAVPGIDT